MSIEGNENTPGRLCDERPHRRFETDAKLALDRLREATRAVLEDLSDESPTAAAFADDLGLSRKLGWQVWTLAKSKHASEAVSVIPGRGAIAQFIKAARKRKVSKDVLSLLKNASLGIDALVEVHAGDRTSLETMLKAVAGEEGIKITEATRRTAFRANSEIFGIQSDVWFTVNILWPGSEPDRIDVVSLTGMVGLRRLRPNAPCIFTGFMSTKRGDYPPGTPRPQPLVSNVEAQGALPPMMPEFCSSPVPGMRVLEADEHMPRQRVELVEGPIGETGTVTCITGEVIPNCSTQYATKERPRGYFLTGLNTPTRLLLCDVLVHRDLWDSMQFESSVTRMPAGPGYFPDKILEADHLPVPTKVEHLGAGLTAAKSKELPRHLELIDWTCRKLGMDSQLLEVYRTKLTYPIIPSVVVRGYDLLPPK